MTDAPSALFTDTGQDEITDKVLMATASFGERTSAGRYKMPLLPGESGPKSGGDWVPRGLQSATNLAGSIVESRELGIWERERTQLGLAVRPDLYERMAFAVRRARHPLHSDWSITRDMDGQITTKGMGTVDLFSPGVRLAEVAPELKAELALIHDEAKRQAGADAAARQGTNRHDVWEARGATGQLFGTPEINDQIERLEQLLADNHLRRVPGLSERVIRNVALRAAGRFDDILQDVRDGTLYMADLKTKRRQFYTWLEVRIQMAVYASAEWMLSTPDGQVNVDVAAPAYYTRGPGHYVNQEVGIVLRMPASGDAPELKRIDLVKGLAAAKLARQVCDMRSEAKSVAAHRETVWS